MLELSTLYATNIIETCVINYDINVLYMRQTLLTLYATNIIETCVIN